MKRRRNETLLPLDFAESTEPECKKRRLQTAHEHELPSLPALQPLELCRVHVMSLRYASVLDATLYDKCQKCGELNQYDSMHFLFECRRCGHFVCNFCFADLYRDNRTTRSPDILAAKSQNAKTDKIGRHRGHRAHAKSARREHKYQYQESAEEGSIASRIRNGRMRRTRLAQ